MASMPIVFLVAFVVLQWSTIAVHATFVGPFFPSLSITPPGKKLTYEQFRRFASTTPTTTAAEKILVVGGTGGVGQLVTKKLLSNAANDDDGGGCQVVVTCRDKSRGEETLMMEHDNRDNNPIVVELDLTNKESQSTVLPSIMEGVTGMVISIGTTAFPTARWRGGNTPQAIDNDAVTALANAASKCDTMKKVILVTSVGVHRTNEMPFVFLNLFGVLDAKRSGEEAIKKAAGTLSSSSSNFNYVIIRPGRLVGGPFTNLDVARLLQIEGGAENGVICAPGDALLGDCKRDACAEAIVQALHAEEATNIEFSIISADDKPALTHDQWKTEFSKMRKTSVT